MPVIKDALEKNFLDVSVEIVQNPDLTQEPFYLASPGIGGDATIIEFGDNDYLMPHVDQSRVYDLVPLIREIENYHTKSFFACGSGAGPYKRLSEEVYNIQVHQNGSIDNESHIIRIAKDGGIEVRKVPNHETRASLLGNIFLSEGKSEKVLKVLAKNRTGEENFITAMRKGLTETFSDDQIVGLGGVFVMNAGMAKVHVMNPVLETSLETIEDLNKWLTWHEVSAPLICAGDFVSQQTDFELRFHHFHCFSKNNQGGHYHDDTTPAVVEYEGYFNVAERIIIVDKNL